MKGLYAFFCFDLASPLSLELVERMASLASRYSALSRQMKPFTKALYDMVSSFQGCHASVRHLSSLAVTDVVMWRAFLCLIHFEEARVARPLSSFVPRPPTVLFGSDASLYGLGVGVSVLNEARNRYQLVAFARLNLPYKVSERDSSYQNTDEFLGILLGLLIVKQTGCNVWHLVSLLMWWVTIPLLCPG